MKSEGIVFGIDRALNEIEFRRYRSDREVGGGIYVMISKLTGTDDKVNFKLYFMSEDGPKLLKEATVESIAKYYEVIKSLETDLQKVNPKAKMTEFFGNGFALSRDGRIKDIPEDSSMGIAKMMAARGDNSLLEMLAEMAGASAPGVFSTEKKKSEDNEDNSSSETSSRLNRFMQ